LEGQHSDPDVQRQFRVEFEDTDVKLRAIVNRDVRRNMVVQSGWGSDRKMIYRKWILLLAGVLRSTGCDGIALIRGMVRWNIDSDRVALLLYTAYVG